MQTDLVNYLKTGVPKCCEPPFLNADDQIFESPLGRNRRRVQYSRILILHASARRV